MLRFALVLAFLSSFQTANALTPAARSPTKTVPKSLSTKYKDHSVYSEVTKPSTSNRNKKCSVVLIHGFGCSSYYWRETTRAISEAGYTVHTIDLLGQGQSEKPSEVTYSTELWTDLVTNYITNNVPDNDNIVLMGNSLGSVVALSCAGATSSLNNARIRGVGLYNCGVGMNSMNLLKDPSLSSFQRTFFSGLFTVLNALIFNNVTLLTYVLEKVVTKELLKGALIGLYPCADNPESRVDEGLVDSFYYPAKDAGSPQALSQIYVNDAGPTPMELHEEEGSQLGRRNIPIHVIWGTKDNITPLSGWVGKFYSELAADPESAVTMDVIDAGHIPFDEIPECNDNMVKWLNEVAMSSTKSSKANGQQQQPLFAGIQLPAFLQK